MRSRIEEGFDAACFDHAGLTEAGPFGYPCSEGHGLHVDEREFVCEIVDPELEPAPPGARGELLITPLRRTGFPVLRYRTGDVVVSTDELCPAGHEDRWLPGGIVGRADDMVVIRGMNVYPAAIEEAVRQRSGSAEFRITFYSERNGMDEVKLEVELAEGATRRALQELMRSSSGCGSAWSRSVPAFCPGTTARPVALSTSALRGGRDHDREAQAAAQAAGGPEHPRRQRAGRVTDPALHSGRGLGPGDFLGREEDLASAFGVSRPTLREALKLLSSGNLIRATKGPGGGIFVAHTAEQGMSRSLSDAIAMMLETGAVSLDELLDARLFMEVQLAGLAAYQPDESTLKQLRASRGAAAAAPDDPEVIAATDAEIHRRSPPPPATGCSRRSSAGSSRCCTLR